MKTVLASSTGGIEEGVFQVMWENTPTVTILIAAIMFSGIAVYQFMRIYHRIEKNQNDLSARFEQSQNEVNMRFEKVERDIADLNIRMIKVEERLNAVEVRLAVVEVKLDMVIDKLNILTKIVMSKMEI
ncbi:MAG TPA: hypothetical protein VK666_01065 [Chryseolinea sp.]|nr:hypothetical protein [Chryseolinea sp.]